MRIHQDQLTSSTILYCPIPTRYCNILQAPRIMLSTSRHDRRLAVACLSWQSGYLARSARSASSGRIRHCSPGQNGPRKTPSPDVSSASQSMPICRNVPRTVKSALPAMWTWLYAIGEVAKWILQWPLEACPVRTCNLTELSLLSRGAGTSTLPHY